MPGSRQSQYKVKRRFFLTLFICLTVLDLFAQKKYIKSLDSLVYYFKHVKIIEQFGQDTQKPLKDSIIFIETKYKNYYSNLKRTEEIKGKSIIFLNYSKHICILDLNAYDTNSIVIVGEFISLIDTSKHIYYNSKHRIGGRGFFHLKEIQFIADNEKTKERFAYFFRKAINYCNRGKFRKRKKYTIERWNFDELNK